MADEDQRLHDRIKMRAYELWEQQGRPEGRATQHWDEATREVLDAWHGTGEKAPPMTGKVDAPHPRVDKQDQVRPGASADTGGTPGATTHDLGRGAGTGAGNRPPPGGRGSRS